MTSNYKMKSLLKGLRYISHMFENEKEPEMQIGSPTDVKHVAHIGWDGGALNQNSPTWMNDFKPLGGYSSSPLHNTKDNASCISEGPSRSRDRPGVPRWSRERSSNLGGSPTKEQSKRGSSNPKSSRRSKKSSDNNPEDDGLRKSRRKKSKDSVNGGGSSRSSRRSSLAGSQTKSIS